MSAASPAPVGAPLSAEGRGFFSQVEDFLNRHQGALQGLVLFYIALLSFMALSPILFIDNAVFPVDGSAYMKQVSYLVQFFQGQLTMDQVAEYSNIRSVVYQYPVALMAWALEIYSPQFYILCYWLLYVLPVPFFIWRLAVLVQGKLNWYATLLPLVFFLDPAMYILSLYGFFTETPSLSLCFMSFVLAYEGLVKSPPRLRKILLLAGASLLLAAGLTSRLHSSLPVVAPAYGLLLLWALWPLSKATWKNIFLFALFFVGATALIALELRVWDTLQFAWALSTSLDNSIWRFGNGGAEFGVENVYTQRLAFYSVSTLLMFMGLILVGFFTGIKPRTHRDWALALIVIGLAVYQIILWTITLPFNPRYLFSLLFFGMVFVIFQQPATARLRLAAGFVILLFGFNSLASFLPPSAPSWLSFVRNTRAYLGDQAGVGKMYSENVRFFSHKDYRMPFPEIFESLAKVHQRYADEIDSVRAPAYQLAYFSGLKTKLPMVFFYTYLDAHWLSDVNVAQLRDKIWQPLTYISEMRVDEIYLDHFTRNMQGLMSANAIISRGSRKDQRPFGEEGWLENSIDLILQNPDMAQKHGLKLENDFVVQSLMPENRLEVLDTINLYTVTNRTLWRDFLRKQICETQHQASQQRPELLPDLCTSITGLSALPKKLGKLSPNENNMAVDVALYRTKPSGDLKLGAKLKDPDFEKVLGVYVHFVDYSKQCPFMVHDFRFTQSFADVALADIDEAKVEAITRCQYEIAVGIDHLVLGPDLFSQIEYLKRYTSRMAKDIYGNDCLEPGAERTIALPVCTRPLEQNIRLVEGFSQYGMLMEMTEDSIDAAGSIGPDKSANNPLMITLQPIEGAPDDCTKLEKPFAIQDKNPNFAYASISLEEAALLKRCMMEGGMANREDEETAEKSPAKRRKR